MGFYITQRHDGRELPTKDKADSLLLIQGVYQIHPPPKVWEEDLVCVVQNPTFDAAAYIFDQEELDRFAEPDDRRRTWLHVPDAAGLTHYGRSTPRAEWDFSR